MKKDLPIQLPAQLPDVNPAEVAANFAASMRKKIERQDRHTRIKVMFAVLGVLFVIIMLNFILHCVNIKAFNKVEHTLASSETSTAVFMSEEVADPWNKEDALVDGVTNGSTYEFLVGNVKSYDMNTWTLRIDIPKDCYINQAWNGTVEIHQNVNSGNPVVQTLDLHDFTFELSELKLEYAGDDKNDFMVHLYEGDYIIYHPSASNSAHEFPLGGDNASTRIGIIFYYDTSLELKDYTLTYTFQKEITDGVEFIIFCILSAVWIVLLGIVIFWFIMDRRAQRKLAEREAMLDETMGLISSFVDAKDPYTRGHSTRVAEYTYLLAEQLKLPQDDRDFAYYSAILHDVGKCYVPDEVLKKPGRLTDEEFAVIKKHTIYGAEMLKDIHSIKYISDGAHYHHERYDGKGYPEGLAGENIPFIARIICVADSFDAMTSTRCYRKELTRDYVMGELENNKGKQFDPEVVDAMIALIRDGKIVIESWKHPDAGSEQ